MKFRALCWGALALSIGLMVNACSKPDMAETAGEKQEWASLQDVEVSMRNIPLNEPTVRTISDQEFLGVRGSSGTNIWIMLKPESPPYYKQMPQGQYDVPAELVERLNREHRLNYTAGVVLRSHIRER